MWCLEHHLLTPVFYLAWGFKTASQAVPAGALLSTLEALDAVYATEPSELDPGLAAAAYSALSKEKW